MSDEPTPLKFTLIKVREATPAPGRPMGHDRVWCTMAVFPPATAPAFAGSVWYWHEPARGHRTPALHILPLGDGGAIGHLQYANLWFNPKFSTVAALDGRPGWRRLDFIIAFEAGPGNPQLGRLLIRCLVETAPGTFASQDLGLVAPGPHGWEFDAADKEPPPFVPARQGTTNRTVLVGGAPKSGTTWMQMLLNAHPEVIGNGEGAFFGLIAVAPPRYTNGWFPPGMDIHQLTDLAHVATLRHVFDLYRGWFGCRVIAEKSPGNSAMARRMMQALPEALFIHCVRHPLDVLVSRLHHEAALMVRDLAPPELANHAAAVAELIPVLRDGTPVSLRGGVWDLVQAILDDWLGAQAEALQALEFWPERVRVTRYEDMLTDGRTEAARAFAFVGVATDLPTVEAAVAQTSLANLRDKTPDQVGTTFFRAGTARQFEAMFARADQMRMFDYLRAALPAFDRFGYTVAARRKAAS